MAYLRGHYHTDITLETLERYLRDRLPELSQHHWRPIQTPLMVIPSHINKQQLIFPTAVYSGEHAPVGASSAFIPRTSIEAEDIYEENFYNGGTGLRPQTTVSVLEPTDTVFTTPPATPNHVTSIPVAMVPYTSTSESTANGWRWWQPLLFWGGAVLVLALMIAAVVLRNRDALTNPQAIETTPPNVSPNTSPLVNTPPSSQTVPQNTAQPTTASPQTSLQSRLQANQETLERAKRLLRHNHASLFNKAIVEARQVKPGDPLYQQARQDITRWSGVILDLAEGRAKEGNFAGAIVAAQLVPKDDPSVYAKAQQAINQWTLLAKQQEQNKAIIQAAKAQLQPNQASSYSRAITTLRQVLPNQPRYAEAQQLTAQWSRTIYLIAQSRAARGRLQEAIQTAALVPAGTPSSDAAKAAIAKWQQGKR